MPAANPKGTGFRRLVDVFLERCTGCPGGLVPDGETRSRFRRYSERDVLAIRVEGMSFPGDIEVTSPALVADILAALKHACTPPLQVLVDAEEVFVTVRSRRRDAAGGAETLSARFYLLPLPGGSSLGPRMCACAERLGDEKARYVRQLAQSRHDEITKVELHQGAPGRPFPADESPSRTSRGTVP